MGILDFEGKDFTNVAFKIAQEFAEKTDLPDENKTSLLRMLLYEHSFVEAGLKIGASSFGGTHHFTAPPKKASHAGLKKTFTQKSFAQTSFLGPLADNADVENLLSLDGSSGNKQKMGRV